MKTLQAERADGQLLSIGNRNVSAQWTPRMGGHARAGQFHHRGISVRVIGVTMSVDDHCDGQTLFPRALDERLRRVGRIDQHTLVGLAITQQVAEVTIATTSDLFEDETHG
jgi:hypothetical protein